MKTDGPYKVGVRRIKITEKQLEAAVFYPVDQSTTGERDLWWQNPEKTIKGMQDVFAPMFGIPFFPDFLLRPNTIVKTHALVAVEICERFSNGKNPLRPIIFSHGLGAHLNFYTATYHALAAHGYLVIALNH